MFSEINRMLKLLLLLRIVNTFAYFSSNTKLASIWHKFLSFGVFTCEREYSTREKKPRQHFLPPKILEIKFVHTAWYFYPCFENLDADDALIECH